MLKGVPGNYTIDTAEDFYIEFLNVVGGFFSTEWDAADVVDKAYMKYNAGRTRFAALETALNSPNHPERKRMVFIDWAIHYKIRSAEWDDNRSKANKFYIARHAFKDYIEGNVE